MLREELIREFGKFGKLHDVWVAKKPPGFAFVEYINSRDAERVVHELDDTKVDMFCRLLIQLHCIFY